MNKVAKLSMPIMRIMGLFFLNIVIALRNTLIPFQVLQILEGGIQVTNTIHWIKSISFDKVDVGKFASPG